MPYEFTADAFRKFTEDVLQANGDQATLTTIMSDMQDTVTAAIAKDIDNAKTVETVTAENERLKKANMDLFLRVGSQMNSVSDKKQEEPQPETTSTKDYMNSYFARLDAAGK